DLDFDRITTSSEIFDPDSQVVRSSQSTTENNSNAEEGGQTVSVANNLPQTPGQQAPNAGGAGGNKSSRNEETTNYEINTTVRSQVRESGSVKRLSVAVAVDGTYEAGTDGKETYKARSDEEMAKIKSLVQSAVNFDSNRGDSVDVVNMQFAQAEPPKEA